MCAKISRHKNSLINKDCPKNIKLMANFDFKRFKGTWYEIFTSYRKSIVQEQCDRVTFTSTNYGSFSLYRKFINANGIEIKMLGVSSEIQPSVMIMFYPAYPSEKI
jgi:hypothetical protein